MGRVYVPPPDPAARVSVSAPMPGGAPIPSTLALGGNLIDRFVTFFQLGIALLFLVSSDYFHIAETTNSLLEEFGVSARIPAAMDNYGWLLLGANILFLLVTFVWAYRTLRRGRLAFYIPLVGYLAFSVVIGLLVGFLL